MRIKTYTACSLAEFYTRIADITNEAKQIVGQPLWFRGHPYDDYKLLPSLLRSDVEKENMDECYNTGLLREDYRVQNYKARVYHIAQTKPGNRIEWMALYQHNFGKTRLLDWSESARTALSFALEPYLDPRPREDLIHLRQTLHPTVWILNPKKLNEKVYGKLTTELVEKAMKAVDLVEEADSVKNDLSKDNHYFEISTGGQSDISLDGILNLGVIDEYRANHAGEIRGLLKEREFNPFFYLCLRYYVDGLPVEIKNYHDIPLPPLAILHQYQSERIRAQRGVFTIFPNYTYGFDVKSIRKLGYDYRAMENMKESKECLCEIRLLDPRRIARELLSSGERRTELYPENEYYAHTLEADRFFA